MKTFETEVLIDGQQEKVFDIVTTIGHWVRWASIARAVGGVTERPIQLGEPIYEFVRTPTGPQEVVWHITEHDRPRRMKLEVEDGTSITYHFTPQGDGTVFRRVFVLGSVWGAQDPLPYSADNSKVENAKVKEMAESILYLEQKGSAFV